MKVRNRKAVLIPETDDRGEPTGAIEVKTMDGSFWIIPDDFSDEGHAVIDKDNVIGGLFT